MYIPNLNVNIKVITYRVAKKSKIKLALKKYKTKLAMLNTCTYVDVIVTKLQYTNVL